MSNPKRGGGATAPEKTTLASGGITAPEGKYQAQATGVHLEVCLAPPPADPRAAAPRPPEAPQAPSEAEPEAGPLAAALRVAIEQTEAEGGDAEALKNFENWHLEASRKGEAGRRHLLNNESVIRHICLIGSREDSGWVAGLDCGWRGDEVKVKIDVAGDFQIEANGRAWTFDTPLEIAEFFRGLEGGTRWRREASAIVALRNGEGVEP